MTNLNENCYLVSSEMLPDLQVAQRTISVLRNDYGARCVASCRLGLVYQTERPLTEDELRTLGVRAWVVRP